MLGDISRPWPLFHRWVKTISTRFALLAQFSIFILTLLMASEVIMRYFFNSPIPGNRELVEFLGVIFVSSSVAHCAVAKGHVDVDLVFNLFPNRVKTVISILTGLLAFVMWALVSWRAFIFAWELYHSPMMSAVLSFPKYPFAVIAGIGCSLLALVILTETIEFFVKVVKP